MDQIIHVAGYACTFNQVDEHNDIIISSAFSQMDTHQDNPNFLKSSDIKFLYQHDVTRPIGKWHIIKPDQYGLYVEGTVNCGLSDGYAASVMMQDDLINGLSIGYKAISSYRDSDGYRILEKIRLFEISLVTFPMQENAFVKTVVTNEALF